MNRHTVRLALLVLMLSLAGCVSGPRTKTYLQGGEVIRFDLDKDPYWADPKWDRALLETVQASVHDPADPADTSTPELHAVVKFTYLAGTVEYPEIVQSTGDAAKDELLLHQVAAVQLPPATGIDADKPHEFVLDLDMPTPYEAFRNTVLAALNYARVYPKDAVMAGEQGTTVISLDYLDGMISNVAVIRSSGSHSLDKASVNAVMKAVVPPPPASYAGKTLHLEPEFCYSLHGPGKCATSRQDVIQVFGTRI